MNCKTIKKQMSLAVGEDLSITDALGFHRHLRSCSNCQADWERYQSSFAALQQSRVEETLLNRASVWPTISLQIEQRHQQRPTRRSSNNGVATLFLAAACVLASVSLLEDYTFEMNNGGIPGPLFFEDVVLANYNSLEPIQTVSPPVIEPVSSGDDQLALPPVEEERPLPEN